MSAEEVESSLIVSFDDQSASFTHGFEAGIIWKRMMDGEPTIEGCNSMMCHGQNAEVLSRMAVAQQYEIEVTHEDGEWFMPIFRKARHRFMVIDGGVH